MVKRIQTNNMYKKAKMGLIPIMPKGPEIDYMAPVYFQGKKVGETYLTGNWQHVIAFKLIVPDFDYMPTFFWLKPELSENKIVKLEMVYENTGYGVPPVIWFRRTMDFADVAAHFVCGHTLLLNKVRKSDRAWEPSEYFTMYGAFIGAGAQKGLEKYRKAPVKEYKLSTHHTVTEMAFNGLYE